MARIRRGVDGLYDAIAIESARGVTLQPGRFAERDDRHVCLCGAVLAAVNVPLDDIATLVGKDVIHRVARILGITFDQAGSLNNGFEGQPPQSRAVFGGTLNGLGWEDIKMQRVDKKWHTIGKSIRRHWLKAQ